VAGKVQNSIPSRVKTFSVFKISLPALEPNHLPFSGYLLVISTGVKQPELDVSHWPPSNGQVKNYRHYTSTPVGRDRSVGITTRYGLDGPGIESQWGRDFPHPSITLWGLPSLLYNGYRVFPGGKAAGAWRWAPTPSSAEIKERVELYLYYTSGPSWPVLGWILSLPLTLPLPLLYTSAPSICLYGVNAESLPLPEAGTNSQ
jgi:hypothetical protein